jgi:uncharacterized protein YjiS (DUF1127 family)
LGLLEDGMGQTAWVVRSDISTEVPRLAAARYGQRLRLLLACWLQRCRQRRALARLDDRLLRDIGVTAADAAAEAAKPFWRN